jgi:hypothetical protein
MAETPGHHGGRSRKAAAIWEKSRIVITHADEYERSSAPARRCHRSQAASVLASPDLVGVGMLGELADEGCPAIA